MGLRPVVERIRAAIAYASADDDELDVHVTEANGADVDGF